MEFIDLKAQYQDLKEDIDMRVHNVINNANFILGEEIAEFEQKLADYVGVKHVVGCSNGTAALQLIYMAYGIGIGDAVFCPDMTFIASVEPACMLGATPIFCDIDMQTYNIDTESLERQIKVVLTEGKYTPKAIVAVDFLGNPADYDKLRSIAEQYNLLLIEDAAQGMGASVNGVKCGGLGDVGATSFFPSKPLGCYGDGGAIFTNDDGLDETLRSLRVHGKGKTKYENIRIGLNSRLDTLQAAVLLSKLGRLEAEIEKRQMLAKVYDEAFEDILQIPVVNAGMVSSYAQYALLAQDVRQRDYIMAELKRNNIPTLVYYPNPLHLLPVFKDCFMGEETFENTIAYANRTFSVPFSAYLTQEDQEKVIAVIKQIV